MTGNDELQAVFRTEADELLKELGRLLEAIPGLGGEELRGAVRQIMRHAHNLKGAAAVVGQEDIETLAHALEDTLGPFAKAEAPPPEEVLAAAEASVAVAQRLAEGESLPELVQEMLRELAVRRQGATTTTSTAGASEPAPVPRPEKAEAVPAAASEEHPPADPSPAARSSEAGQAGGGAPESIRIETSRLDRLMAFGGELLVAQAWQTARRVEIEDFFLRFQKAFDDAGLRRQARWAELGRDLEALVRRDRESLVGFVHLTGEINDAMKRLRMLPLRDLAPVWRRIVRDTADKLHKEVDVIFDLGDIELDRYVLDSLRDPLMHFLRNAVDHGIETPDERAAAGKPRAGKVLVRSTMLGTMVRLEISDDGRGVHPERIGEAAVDKGLITAEQLARLGAGEITALLFLPGFSTAKSVSRISGRGVGLDVVKRRVEALGGSVEIATPPALGGTTFYLTVPVSLLSAKGLLVRAGPATYVLPTDSVKATRRIEPASVQELGGTLVAGEDGQPLRIRYLTELARHEAAAHRGDKLSVVVLVRGSEQLGIVVDEVLREQELVTKRLPWNLRRVPGVSGAVILADGALAVAVDVGYLFEAAGQTTLRPGIASPAPSPQARERVRILVVEDSLTARLELQRLLSEAGYEVIASSDGEDAWTHLEQEDIQLVISDVQMPRLDGFGLTRRIRASSSHRDLPVVLVTSLASADDVAQGAAAGADEYLVKGSYSREALLQAVERLV